MRTFLILFVAVSAYTLASQASAQGGCGGGRGMQSGGIATAGSSGVMPSMGSQFGSLSQTLAPNQAFLQAQAAMAAYQAQEREKRLTQHNSVYVQRRAAEVAARASRTNRSQSSAPTLASFSP